MGHQLTKALADDICQAYKLVGDYRFEVVSRLPTTKQTSDKLISEGDWPLHVFSSFTPSVNAFTIALSFDDQHIRRFDSNDHKGYRPHIHWFVKDPLMHEDVREVPSWFEDCRNFEKTLRDFFRLCRITFNQITVVEATRFDLD